MFVVNLFRKSCEIYNWQLRMFYQHEVEKLSLLYKNIII